MENDNVAAFHPNHNLSIFNKGFLSKNEALYFTSSNNQTESLMHELQKGNFFLEFFVQAIPCYIFVLAYFKRYKEIKDLGSPR